MPVCLITCHLTFANNFLISNKLWNKITTLLAFNQQIVVGIPRITFQWLVACDRLQDTQLEIVGSSCWMGFDVQFGFLTTVSF